MAIEPKSEDSLSRQSGSQFLDVAAQGSRQHLYLATAVVYLLGLIVAETATVFVSFEIGIIYYSGLLLLILLHTAYESGTPLFGFCL